MEPDAPLGSGNVQIIHSYVCWFEGREDGVSTWLNNSKRIRLANPCLLYTSPSPRDLSTSRMPSSA